MRENTVQINSETDTFHSVNGTVSEIDLWTDGIHLIESGKRIITNKVINNLNYFWKFLNAVS